MRTTSKAGRLLLLHRLREAGVIGDSSLREIARILGVNASTVLRDLRVLEQVDAEYRRLLAEQPWSRELTPAEFAAELGVSAETVRMMIRDGLIKAHKVSGKGRGRGSGEDKGRWMIPVDELDRWHGH